MSHTSIQIGSLLGSAYTNLEAWSSRFQLSPAELEQAYRDAGSCIDESIVLFGKVDDMSQWDFWNRIENIDLSSDADSEEDISTVDPEEDTSSMDSEEDTNRTPSSRTRSTGSRMDWRQDTIGNPSLQTRKTSRWVIVHNASNLGILLIGAPVLSRIVLKAEPEYFQAFLIFLCECFPSHLRLGQYFTDLAHKLFRGERHGMHRNDMFSEVQACRARFVTDACCAVKAIYVKHSSDACASNGYVISKRRVCKPSVALREVTVQSPDGEGAKSVEFRGDAGRSLTIQPELDRKGRCTIDTMCSGVKTIICFANFKRLARLYRKMPRANSHTVPLIINAIINNDGKDVKPYDELLSILYSLYNHLRRHWVADQSPIQWIDWREVLIKLILAAQ